MKIDYRRIISTILVVFMVILSGEIPRESIWCAASEGLFESNRLHNISDGDCLYEVEDAIVPSATIHKNISVEYRIFGRKENGNTDRQLRILHFSFTLLCSVFAMPLLWAFYVYFIGEQEQKLLIIKYIHDKDGLKSTSIIRYP